VTRVSGGYRIALAAIPRTAIIRATFDGSDPIVGPEVPHGEMDAPPGAVRLRAVAEVNGQFSKEEDASLLIREGGRGGPAATPPRVALKPDAPVTLTSRFEPKDTAAAFAALDRLAKIPGVKLFGGNIDLNGGRAEADYLVLRLGSDVAFPAVILGQKVKELVELLAATAPTVKLRLDGIAFPSGRELMAFCDASGEDFDRVQWKQD
jgi:hypothetical protein